MKKYIKNFTKYDLLALCGLLTKEEVAEMIKECFPRRAMIECIHKIYDTHDEQINTKLERFYFRKLKERNGQIKPY